MFGLAYIIDEVFIQAYSCQGIDLGLKLLGNKE